MRSSLLYLLALFTIVYIIKPVRSEEEDFAATAPPDDASPPESTTKGRDEVLKEGEVTTTTAHIAEQGPTTANVPDTSRPLPMIESNGTTGKPTEATFKEKYEKFKKQANVYVKEKAKQIMDILNFDLTKLNVRNLTQFIPFYDDYSKLFNKNYSTPQEKSKRMSFFKRSIEKIKEHNKNIKAKYQQGINELSDMNFSEILRSKLGLKQDGGDKMVKASAPVPPVDDLPEEWDWRKYGILTIPRNQGKCGSCWSFAAACVLESHNMKRLISEGKFDPTKQITVSEQNLIDCSGDFGTIGCDGGMPQQGFKYVHHNQGIMGVLDYPYKGKKEKCLYEAGKKVDVVVKEGKRLKTGADQDLVTAIYNYGPVAIAVHVTKDMAAYKTGIFDDPKCNPKKVNHAVVAVGYSKEFFIIRNSWGPKWGEGGYIKISRTKINNCGVSQQGYYPVLPTPVETTAIAAKLKVVNQ